MRKILSLLSFVACGICFISIPAHAGDVCDLQKVQFSPPQGSTPNQIVGKFKSTQITLESEPTIPKSTTLTFDLPMKALTKTGKTCKLGEGLWEKEEIYVNQEENVVAGVECSGSECTLTFYNLSDCAKKESILFAGKMRLEGRRVVMEGACEYLDNAKSKGYCGPAKIYELESSCKPKLLSGESLALTKKKYGVEFSEHSTIVNVHTPRAEVIKP